MYEEHNYLDFVLCHARNIDIGQQYFSIDYFGNAPVDGQ